MNKASQNAYYTFKYNRAIGRHGWLRLTPAYSVKIVQEVIESLPQQPKCVLDPFSGTATTPLECINSGISSFAIDINPFLVWFGNVKLKDFSDVLIAEFEDTAREIIEKVQNKTAFNSDLPPIYRIDRWWREEQLEFLSAIKGEISKQNNGNVKDLLLVAFCRAIIENSKAAFNHVSTSFKDDSECEAFDLHQSSEQFIGIIEMIVASIKNPPSAVGEVILHDSRSVPEKFVGQYDTVITSPPYPNRISYIRELRPYMYWLDYITDSTEASDLDWASIGGTWGSATSKLGRWESTKNGRLPTMLYEIANEISRADNKSSFLMANYVTKYFEDMYDHLQTIFGGLSCGGSVHYTIGNSNFYGITVPSEVLYESMMKDIGFKSVTSRVIRKRNSKKELFEYVVSATK
ncbi:MAG: DNA adenine methylase [Synergistaceae bacterium]|jgi:hypothetical protein|nr:DNA adenine methylase [Synergistaceae bacterium]